MEISRERERTAGGLLQAVEAVAEVVLEDAGGHAEQPRVPSQPACVPRLWQDRQVSLTAAAGKDCEPLDIPLRVVVHVGLPWTVAAFASERGSG
jgi:hypothetical protein